MVDRWSDFFVAAGGAAAALTGLLFIAVSLRPREIRQSRLMIGRPVGVLVMSAPFTAAAIRAHRLNYVRAALYHGGLLAVAAGGVVRALDGDPRDYAAVLATGVLVLLGIALSNSWQLVISHESDGGDGIGGGGGGHDGVDQ